VAVAVFNAIDSLKSKCDLVMPGHHGQGVVQLIDRMISDDLASLGPREPRRKLADRAAQSSAKQPSDAPPAETPPEEQAPEPPAESAPATAPRSTAKATAKVKRKP
jgi:hypothetical protein